MGRPVVHWESWSQHPERAAELYKRVFDWNIRLLPDLNYDLVETGGEGGINGGIMKPQAGPWPGNMAFYIDVDDLDAYGKRIIDTGGEILVDRRDVPDVGQLSLFADPDGRVLGMWNQRA